ncbi:hypothetical protein COU15_00575 [Candidatus Kaiserbacteria bacterium CG10_big_fil_rev_8_21_14_0_10_45_20]|uniref:Fe2OG dioxygenase domain-containing protein n=1 Tax=Candidatus Kaiserbacteria bacterium CG10_big_fil_rev_8_21_14_0_10_45_20 TaxID=1974607 RepID=A0A2H0UGD0_9BACT|nr:MAG: hypothetical protein COU15_00575 [Candidatus Kaiserbacteria bacterium CG10_big_fil_rev_8_21_14_0_10_45_20]
MENGREGKGCGACTKKGRSLLEGISPLLKSWERDGYATAPIEISKEGVHNAIDSFVSFTAIPKALRSKICAYLPEDEKRVHLGVGIRKPESDGDGEHKEFFHYHPDVAREFKNKILQAGPEAVDFLKHADRLWVNIAKQVKEIIEMQITPVYYQKLTERFIPTGEKYPRVILRFLAYKDANESTYSAKEHYDRSTVTLAITESAPGLWVENPRKGKRSKIKHKAGQAVFFPWFGFNYAVDSNIQPTLHGVEQQQGEQYSNDVVRWATEVFTDIPNAPTPPKSKTVTL